MQSTTEGNNAREDAKSESMLGCCLFDADAEATARARRTRRKTFGVSLAIEILMLASLVAAPLFSGVARPYLHLVLPSQLTFFRVSPERNMVQRPASPGLPRDPEIQYPYSTLTPHFPPGIVRRDEGLDGPPLTQFDGYVPGIFGDTNTNGGKPPSIAEPLHVELPAQQVKHPLKFSEGVLAAQLISRVEPAYPFLAKETKTEGTVRLHAIISREGRIVALDVISGHPLLVMAALDAVRQWRYRPTLLNGEPIEVETSITVIFRLHE
jgi:periplasmic protein TonB